MWILTCEAVVGRIKADWSRGDDEVANWVRADDDGIVILDRYSTKPRASSRVIRSAGASSCFLPCDNRIWLESPSSVAQHEMPNVWFGASVKLEIPILANLRLDPFERTGFPGSVEYFSRFKYEFWRFVYVQQEAAKLAQTAIEFPPMQKGAASTLRPPRRRSRRAPGADGEVM